MQEIEDQNVKYSAATIGKDKLLAKINKVVTFSKILGASFLVISFLLAIVSIASSTTSSSAGGFFLLFLILTLVFLIPGILYLFEASRIKKFLVNDISKIKGVCDKLIIISIVVGLLTNFMVITLIIMIVYGLSVSKAKEAVRILTTTK